MVVAFQLLSFHVNIISLSAQEGLRARSLGLRPFG
jgi:hypothetical protein